MVQPQDSEPASSRTSANLSSEHATPSDRQVVEEQLYVAKTVLQQAIDLLDNHITSDEQLTVHSKFMPGSTIGQFFCVYASHLNHTEVLNIRQTSPTCSRPLRPASELHVWSSSTRLLV